MFKAKKKKKTKNLNQKKNSLKKCMLKKFNERPGSTIEFLILKKNSMKKKRERSENMK